MIELKNIYKSFKNTKTPILKNINLNIKKGDFACIMGQSGSGKSTLMNILGCLDLPSKGSYKINNEEILKLDSNELANLRQNKFGFIFQKYNLLPTLNSLENVALPAVYKGIKKAKREKRAKELLERLGLGDKLKSYPRELSGGQQQRVSIARSIMNGGEIILADEPTGALDSKSGIAVMQILSELNSLGHTIILVTHDEKVASYANKIINIKDGAIENENIVKNVQPIELKKEKSSSYFIKDQAIESFKIAINSIKAHKLRSILTMLGIIIGIASVVSIMALGKGSQEKILEDISSIGTSTMSIYPGLSFGDLRHGSYKSLEMSDVNLLLSQTYIDSVTPNASTTGITTYKNLSFNAVLNGGSEQSFLVRGISLKEGRMINKNDIKNNSSVAIIDENSVNLLFKKENAIGKIIIFDNKPFKIIGISKDETYREKGTTLEIWTAYSTLINKITGDKNVRSITLKVKDNIDMELAEKSVIKLLEKKRGTRNFFVRNSDTLKKTIESTTSTLTLFILAIALISLIVGGIGVMNIMLVSVTERTREIGIRMAIGAKRSNILSQFLIEAVFLCIIGGILGVLLSFGIGYVFNELIKEEFAMKFSTNSIILAIISSSLIGIVFGFIPARNASKLNPIQALSRE